MHMVGNKDAYHLAEYLIALGLNINARHQYIGRPLDLCVMHDAPQTAKVLIRAGSDPTIDNLTAKPLLLVCLERSRLAMVRMLIEEGVDIKDSVEGAIRTGAWDLLVLLIQCGIDSERIRPLVEPHLKNCDDERFKRLLDAEMAI